MNGGNGHEPERYPETVQAGGFVNSAVSGIYTWRRRTQRKKRRDFHVYDFARPIVQ